MFTRAAFLGFGCVWYALAVLQVVTRIAYQRLITLGLDFNLAVHPLVLARGSRLPQPPHTSSQQSRSIITQKPGNAAIPHGIQTKLDTSLVATQPFQHFQILVRMLLRSLLHNRRIIYSRCCVVGVGNSLQRSRIKVTPLERWRRSYIRCAPRRLIRANIKRDSAIRLRRNLAVAFRPQHRIHNESSFVRPKTRSRSGSQRRQEPLQLRRRRFGVLPCALRLPRIHNLGTLRFNGCSMPLGGASRDMGHQSLLVIRGLRTIMP